MPRQMPRYGMPPSRATRQARIFPSQPRDPKPPGTAELVADEPVETLSLERLRDEVDAGDVLVCDDGLGLDIGEERDLVPDKLRERLSRAAHDDIGMDTDQAQPVDPVLRRFRF